MSQGRMGSGACRNEQNQHHYIQGSSSFKGGARYSTNKPSVGTQMAEGVKQG